MKHPLSDLARRFGGQIDAGSLVTGFATDHREVKPGDLFIAIKGERVDGHDFWAAARELGAAACLAERPLDGPCIVVPDVIEALAKMALSFRNQFEGPVIGITGSAGKTTTKEFTAACLGHASQVLKTEGNRNSEFTGPLLWPELTPQHRFAVVEAGMRGFGQIAHLVSFHRPTIGVITNIGYAHLELVGGRDGIAKAKSELLHALPEDGTAILFTEDEYLGELVRAAGDRRIRTFGAGGNADCQVTGYRALDWTRAEISGVLDGSSWSAVMPAVGRHLANNAAAALLAATEAGASLVDAAARLESATLPPMRMETRQFNGFTLVMDTYNSNPPAVLGALQTLEEVPAKGKKVAVLGTMRELGEESEKCHRQIGRRLSKSKLDHIFVYGSETQFIVDEFLARRGSPDKIRSFDSLEAIREALGEFGEGDTVLVKGSRALYFERIFEE